jgi:hypothetical protein
LAEWASEIVEFDGYTAWPLLLPALRGHVSPFPPPLAVIRNVLLDARIGEEKQRGKLPEPDITEEERQTNILRLKEMVEGLK